MNDAYRITCDLFTLPYKDEDHILYAPRIGFVFVANPDLVNLLADLEAVRVDALSQEQKSTLDFLVQKGVLNGSHEVSVVKTIPEKYTPMQVTLFPTNQCNLNCTYCYASAGDWTPLTMDWHYATSAIDIVIENIKAKGAKDMGLGFHGGGEPLFPWELIKRIVGYAEDRCAKEGLKLGVFSATNALLSERQLEWIVKHFHSLNISFDGLPHVQNYHRPLRNGKASFEYVDRTMRFLDEHQFSYGVRSTISAYNVDLMEESLDFIGQNYKVKPVQFEPLFYCGRCRTSSHLKPDMDKFYENFRTCEQKCPQYGIALTYSGCRIESLTGSFCGVSQDNFSVTPDGFITTCYEVTSADDPKSETFFIGRINSNGQLEIDEKKRRFLHSLTVDRLDYCQDCFAKWHCAGDCAAKIDHGNYSGPRGHERCLLNRQLVANRLISLIDGTYYHPAMKNLGNEQAAIPESKS